MERFALGCLTLALGLACPRGALAADGGVDGGGGSSGSGGSGGSTAYDVLASYCSDSELECTTAPLEYAKTISLPIAFDFDTGWVPQGSDLQVRFFAKLPASTTVELDGALETTWPEAMTLATPGGNHGLLKFDYGLEIGAKAKLDVSVIGVPVKWEGDIPGLPKVNFHLAAEKTFEPWAFAPNTAVAKGTSTKLRVFEANLLDLAGIPSQISKGGVAVDIYGDLTATYQTERIRIEPAKVTEGAITSATGTTTRAFAGGAFVEYDVFPEGRVDYDGTLHLVPAFFVSVLGKDFSLPIADVPVSFNVGKQDFVFDPVRVHVPLPDLEEPPTSLDFGSVKVGDEKSLSVTLTNTGEAKARATGFVEAPGDVAFVPVKPEVMVESQKSTTYSVTFAPKKSGKVSTVLTLLTNDPDQRFIKIALDGQGLGAAVADAGPEARDESGDSGGCGCRVGSTDATPWTTGAALGLLLFGLRRRRVRG